MESELKENKSEEDSSTKHILDYYRKFSQNKDLPKYFSGSSVSYLPLISPEVDEIKSRSVTNKNIKITVDCSDPLEKITASENLELSPVESVTSNKKLEWDNLADIGYDNAKSLHRSFSLPILTQVPDTDKFKTSEPTNDSTGFDSNVRVILCPYSNTSEERTPDIPLQSTTSSYPTDTKVASSTSSSTNQIEVKQKSHSSYLDSSSSEKVISFKETLQYLKSKIGVPDAHSTPNDAISTNILETPVLKRNKKPVRKFIRKSKSTEIFIEDLSTDDLKKESSKHENETLAPKNVDLQLIEPDDLHQSKEVSNLKKKVINLCLTKPILLDCISETNLKQRTKSIQTDFIPKSKHKDNSQQILVIQKGFNKENSSTSTSRSSSNAVASKCDSFEYIKNDGEINQRQFLKNEDKHQDSVDNPKNKNIEQNQKFFKATSSRNASSDLEHHIYMLQRLIKSKTYDSSTKKKYIKKILRKITESTYLEDSSTSSELFFPKTDPNKVLKDQLKHSSLKTEPTSSTCQSDDIKSSSPGTNFTKTSNAIITKSTKAGPTGLTKLESKISPKEVKNISDSLPSYKSPKRDSSTTKICSEDHKDSRKGHFTIATKSQKISNVNSSDRNDTSSSTQKSLKNWKESPTNSEIIYESNNKSAGDGDHLVSFATKERDYQLKWIEREINHLGKLKVLLEQTTKPVEKRSTKMTSVYMVTGSDNGKGANSRRNFVIETNLSHKNQQSRNFRINGQNYTVEDSYSKKEGNISRPVTADLEVYSDDKTTNIKVTTFCRVCKATPCTCKSSLDDKPISTNSSSITSSHRYSHKSPIQPVCLICSNGPCLCDLKDSTDGNKCPVCQLYPCTCIRGVTNNIAVKGYIPSFVSGTKEQEVCLCELNSAEGSSSSSKENQLGSLSRVFINCKCEAQCDCDCEFVNKLLQHFSMQNNDTPKFTVDSVVQATTDIQNCVCQTKNDTVPTSYQSVKDWRIKSADLGTSQKISDQSTKPRSRSLDDGVTTVTKESGHTSQDLYLLISRIEQALVDKKLIRKPEMTDQGTFTSKPNTVDQFTSYTPRKLSFKGTSTTDSYLNKNTNVDETGTKPKIHSILKQGTQKKIESATELDNQILPDTNISSEHKNVQYVPCPNLHADKSTCYCRDECGAPLMDISTITARTCLIGKGVPELEPIVLEKEVQYVPCPKLSADKSTSYSPETIDKSTLTSKDTLKSVREKEVQYCPGLNRNTDKTSSYSLDDCAFSVVDENTVTPCPCLVSKGVPEIKTVNESTTYEPPRMERGINYESDKQTTDVGPILPMNAACKETCYDYKVDHERKDESTMTIKGMNAPSKNNTKISLEKAVSTEKKQKSRHKKNCQCNFKCLRSLKTSSSNSKDDPQNKVCVCVCNCESAKKNGKCCCDIGSCQHKGMNSNEDTASNSLSTDTTGTDSVSMVVCTLCHRETYQNRMPVLRVSNKEYAICSECLEKQPVLTTMCLESDKTNSLPSSDPSKTVSNSLDLVESYCTCPKGPRPKHKKIEYCFHCHSQLRKTLKSRNGIAYALTLEEDSLQRSRNTKKKKRPLKEIKVKIACPYNRKNVKNNENIYRRAEDKRKYDKSEEESEDEVSQTGSNSYNNRFTDDNSCKQNNSETFTLQDYLKRNRPDFIDSAEYRRNIVQTNRVERELNKEDMKLKFFDETEYNNKLKRQNKLFSEHEMKEITRRNYKKLPEVQKKLDLARMEKLKNADRLITEIFKKKIQNSILKGKSNFPLDTNIVNYYK